MMHGLMMAAGLLVSLAGWPEARLTMDGQVLQRGEDGTAACVVALPAAVPQGGCVRVTLTGDEAGAAGQTGQTPTLQPAFELVRPQDDPTSGGLDGVLISQLPTGGPYGLEVQVLEASGQAVGEASFKDILVGDLWVLAGQSNMEGVPPVPDELKPVATVHMLNLDGRWLPALPPLHRKYEATAAIFGELMAFNQSKEEIEKLRAQSLAGPPLGGTGPGFFFARELTAASGVPVGLIPCAYGGSFLAQWDPAGLERGDQTLYGNMVRRVQSCGGRAAGMLWYQGESDANNPALDESSDYGARLEAFFTAARRDLGNPQMPIVMAQIARFIAYEGRYAEKGSLDRPWEIVRETQRTLAARLDRVQMAPTVDLEHYDIIHLAYDSQKRLGHRMAWLALPYVMPGLEERRGIELIEARYESPARTVIAVTFSGVSGTLRSAGAPHGFELRSAQGAPMDWVFRIDFDPAQPGRLLLRMDVAPPEGTVLYYAPRASSYVNITDENDMPLPAFGPAPILAAQ